MTFQQITKNDITGWDSLQDIADSFKKRGLKPRPQLGDDNELVLQLVDDEFIVLINAGSGESATDFKPENQTRHTNLVATDNFEEFTFLTRMRSYGGQQHGRIKHQKISFEKSQFTTEGGEKHTILKKLNAIEYGSSTAIYDTLYDTQQVVKEFYQEFEELRTDLVQEVSGVQDDRVDAKQRYVQVILDRMIFLYFIQEKRLLNRDPDYLHKQPGKVVDNGEDRYENFYRPLFFEYLAEDKQHPDFGSLPYLNGGLFAKNPIEEEFPEAKLGESAAKTNQLFDNILEFLSSWNWNVDERLDIVDPKNLSPAILGHIFEQTVNQKEMGAYYTPEEVTGFMSRRTIHPYLLDQLNEAVDADYDEIDEVFGFAAVEASGGEEALADGGTMTQQVPTANVDTAHVETLYHDVLKGAHVLDPAVGSGAFLLAAQEVLVDIYMQCIEFFQQLETEGRGWELEARTRDELEEIADTQGGAPLYAKETAILNNLYGVDIDEGAVEICKLRLWLSMVANIEDEPSEVEPLPNIDFNIRSGDSLIGFESTEVVVDGQKLLITDLLKQDLEEYRDNIEAYKNAEKNISDLRGELDDLHDEMQAQLNDWFADIPDIKVEDDISTPEELREIISASNEDVKFKLKFSDPIDDDLDQKLNDLGFRTWKKAANLEMGNRDAMVGKPGEIFEVVPADELARSFVERGLLEEDIDQLDPFHWVMEFPDAYDAIEDDDTDAASNGFDVILENPPYVRIESVKELQRDVYKDLHDTAAGRCDLYVPFIERSFELLTKKGRSSFITSNQFMNTEYGESLRECLPRKYGLEQIYDFTAYSVFDEVTIYSTILFGSRNVGSDVECVSIRSQEAVEEIISSSFDWNERNDIVEFTLPIDTLGGNRWLILTENERAAREKISDRSDTTLGDEEHFTVGSPLMSGQNATLQAEIVNKKSNRYHIKNSRIEATVKPDIWRPLITSDEVNRWKVGSPSEVMFFPYVSDGNEYDLIEEKIFESEYSNSYEELVKYREKLLNRKDSRQTYKQRGRAWYCLGRVGTPYNFDHPKIVTDIVVNEPHFCIDTEKYVFSHGYLHGITPHETDLFYLTGLLNTQALFSYLKPICPPKNSGYMKIEVDQLKAAPVYLPEIREELCVEFSNLLDEHKGNYEKLTQLIRSQGVEELVSSSEGAKMMAANMLREVSKKIIKEYESLSDDDIEQLENVNNQLSGIIFDLDEKEQEALSRI